MVSPEAVLKYFFRFAKRPWIGTKLAKLQCEKWLFNTLYPRFKEGHANKIRRVSLRLTDMCNLRCTMCGQWGENGYLLKKDLKDLKAQEISYQRYIELFQDLARHGHHPLVYFWGGEPMLYPGILELIETCTAMKLPVSIATNGSRIASSVERIVAAPMFLLQVSVDGHDEASHNSIRRSSSESGNSFSTIISALDAVNEEKAAKKTDLPLVASLTTISKNNYRHLTDIYEAMRHRADVCVFYLSWWIDEPAAMAHEKDFEKRFGYKPTLHWGWVGSWKPDDYKLLDEQLTKLHQMSKGWGSAPVIVIPDIRGVENLKTYYTNHAEHFGFNQCVSIYQAIEVNSNGDVSPCRDYLDYVVGNVRNSTFTELWNSPEYVRFRKSISSDGLMPVCSRCCGLMGE